MGFDSKLNFASPTILLGFSFALVHGISFLGGIQHYINIYRDIQFLKEEFTQSKNGLKKKLVLKNRLETLSYCVYLD